VFAGLCGPDECEKHYEREAADFEFDRQRPRHNRGIGKVDLNRIDLTVVLAN
jgi:hypothetical protein